MLGGVKVLGGVQFWIYPGSSSRTRSGTVSARGGCKVLGGVMFCMILHCFAYVLQKTAVANVQSESARGGPKVLGGVQIQTISNRQQKWELKNKVLAP